MREACSLLGDAAANEGTEATSTSVIGMTSPISAKVSSLNSSTNGSSNASSQPSNTYVMVDPTKKNLDVMNNISSDTQKIFKTLQSAAQQLQSKEFHQLAIGYKVSILRILISSCYETDLFRRIMESNAKIREERISALNKQAREEVQRKRELIAQVIPKEIIFFTRGYVFVCMYVRKEVRRNTFLTHLHFFRRVVRRKSLLSYAAKQTWRLTLIMAK